MLKAASVGRSTSMLLSAVALALISGRLPNALAHNPARATATEQPAQAMDPPVLPEAAAKEVEELGQKIEELHKTGLTAETREAQDAALDEAIKLAEKVLAIRQEHQGNLPAADGKPELARWRDAKGESAEWYEVWDAKRAVETLRRIRAVDAGARTELASTDGMDAEFKRLFGQGEYVKALEIAERQRRIDERVFPGDRLEAVTRLNNLAAAKVALGHTAEAEALSQQALAIVQRLVKGDHPTAANSLHSRAVVMKTLGRYLEAEPLYEQSLAMLQRIYKGDHRSIAQNLGNLGALKQDLGRAAEAEALLEQALAMNQRMYKGDHPDLASSLNYLGSLKQISGRADEAEQLFEQALAMYQRIYKGDHPDLAFILHNLAGVKQDLARVADAERLYVQSLAMYQRILPGDNLDTARCLHNLAVLKQDLKHHAEAEPLFEQALAMVKHLFPGDHPAVTQSLVDLGLAKEALGNAAEAAPLYERALSMAERLRTEVRGSAQERAAFAGELDMPAITYFYIRVLLELDRASDALGVQERGRSRAALDMFAGGRSEAERLLRTSDDTDRLSRYNAALVEEEQARLALLDAENRLTALRKEREALENATTPEDVRASQLAQTDQLIEAALSLIPIRRQALRSATGAAFNELRGLVPAATPMSTEQVLGALGKDQALLSYSWPKYGMIAIVSQNNQVTGVKLIMSRDEDINVRQAIAALRDQIASRPESDTPLSPAVLAAARNAVLPEALRSKLAGVTSLTVIADGPMQGIPLELLLEGVPVSYAPSATIAIDRQHAAARRSERLSSAVVVGDPVFGGNDRPAPKYPETGVLLMAVVDGGNGAAAGLRPGDVLLAYNGTQLKETTDLKPAIDAAQAQLASRGADAGAGSDRPIIAQVWRAGENGTSETVDVKLAPGKLGVQFSLEAPTDGLQSMEFFNRSSDGQKVDAAAVEQIRLHGGGLTPLPATRLEASAVAAMLGDKATLLLGPDATAPRLRDVVEQSPPRVLHLATHGLMGSADQPMLASLALSTPEEPSINDTGFLTLDDIFSHWGGSLRGNELVVLSACDTARGVKQGDTTMALPLGLFVCGTETVIASLWKVDDQATALLMARFYANWLGKSQSARDIDGIKYDPGKPMPKLAALREAKSWLRSLTTADRDKLTSASADHITETAIRGGVEPLRGSASSLPSSDHPYDHPYYWAAFVLMGSPE